MNTQYDYPLPSLMSSINSEDTWGSPILPLALKKENVHIWRTRLIQHDKLKYLTSLLSAEEQVRANCYRFQWDRNVFTVCRGLLRKILALYIGCEANEIVFRYGPYGKPYLAPCHDELGIQFILSHSYDFAVFAITCDRKIGIDLEYVRNICGFEKIAETTLTARENRILNSLPHGERIKTFFDFWTRYEANKKTNESRTSDNSVFNMDSSWITYSFSPFWGYVASLVVERNDVCPILSWYNVDSLLKDTS